ncbi:sugar phosphate isomerase/epimerase family protein [Novipirellula artificiosorum]|uniref:Xylose isomerase-like TIM barrel n=1 Tax=Novipirellula artificiosorum TaxID=2528016 RepID=A0A5C6D7X7_9BACT|nr:sugar phosphate isomerase/epimerase [Novipirellula artificiosorum]TWU31811.1 Xylose isomerase-like TIM barrel [Novipirellula artificiosorum]
MTIKLNSNALPRREFLVATATAMAATAALTKSLPAADSSDSTRVPLGLDGHSLRGMKWKAAQQIEFAAQQRLDAVLLNSLDYFESLDESHLLKLKELANQHEMRIYVGAGGICQNAAKFNDKWGNAQEMLATGIRVASSVGSPVVNVRIGSIADRFLDGGIQPRIDEAVRVLKASSKRAQDAGVKFGFENHAADLRSEELLELIEAVGTDVCGVMLDPGNGLWAMEDPMAHLQALAPHVVCNSLRDYMIWESPEGATFQWTAVGDGLMDVPAYVKTLAKSNPGMPIFVESISNSARPIPFLTEEHWEGYPNLKAKSIVDFLALCRRGHEIGVDEPAEGVDAKKFDQQHQRGEFLKSIEYLRANCRAGLRSNAEKVVEP